MFGIIGKIKRLDRGLVFSVLGHLGLLAIGLLYLGASAHEAVPPDATVVELITPQDMPRFSGTPSDLRMSGSQTQAPPQPPLRAQNAAPQPEQKPQKEQKAQHDPPPKTKAPPMTQMEVGEAMNAPLELPPPDPSEAQPAPTPDTVASVAQRAQQALVGGTLGGGFAAPPVDSPLAGEDWTLLFRERVSSCAPLPAGIDRRDKISVGVRIFLNRDGTVPRPPQLLEGSLSAKQQVLFDNFVSGLEKCQPYTMLPADKYKQWKMLDVVVYPIDSIGG